MVLIMHNMYKTLFVSRYNFNNMQLSDLITFTLIESVNKDKTNFYGG